MFDCSTGKERWLSLAAVIVVTGFSYVLMEWLFFATKPSFMSSMALAQRLLILIVSPLPLYVAGLSTLLVFFGLSLVCGRRAAAILLRVAMLPPVLMLALTAFLLVDNFTTTMFGFGVRNASSWISLLYIFFVIGLCLPAYSLIARRVVSEYSGGRIWTGLAVALVALGLVLASTGESPVASSANPREGSRTGKRQPNILLIGSDGISADHTSVYGYARDTTPYLRELATSSLVCANAFANCSHTGGSVMSLLTGKLPTATRLVYPPDILHGADSYQHLPAILKRHGYRNGEVSIRFYADAFDLNMRDGFDFSNSRFLSEAVAPRFLTDWLGYGVAYFLDAMRERVQSRVYHLAGARRMQDVFAAVAGTESKISRSDQERLAELFEFIQAGRSPFFAHVHLMQTHGPAFRPARHVFSDPSEPLGSLNRYDDAILEFDDLTRQTVNFLRDERLLDNTLIVVYSDHGYAFQTQVRVPLFFHFPQSSVPAGRVEGNVQNIDIAPTLLDYLGIAAPSWMKGVSLLKGRPSAHRSIFSTRRPSSSVEQVGPFWQIQPSTIKAPFYSLGFISVVTGDHWLELDLSQDNVKGGAVSGGDSPGLSAEQQGHLRAILLAHLKESGYEIASLGTVSGR